MKNISKLNIFFKINWILLLIIILAFITSLLGREPNGDESILAEQSYWLQKAGYVKSVMFTGLGFNWEYVQYHYHKLFIVSGALILNTFGITETGLRIFILAFSLLLLYFLFRFSKKELNFKNENLIIFFLILFFQFHFFYFSFIFRPEIPVVTLGFLSFYFLNSYLKYKKNLNLILSGIFAGISVLMHLNGLIFIFSGLALLLFKKEYKSAVYFVFISGITSLLYFFNITSVEEFKIFIYQFTNDPNLHKADFSLILKFNKILSEHLRYFHSPKEIVLSVFFFIALIINFKKLYKDNPNLIIYTLAVLFSLAAIAHDKTDKYSLLYVPFVIIIITQSCFEYKNEHKFTKMIIPVILTLYLSVNSIFIFEIIQKDKNLPQTNSYYSSLMSKKNVYVLTREDFFFNEMENYKIVSLLSFEYWWKRENNFKAQKSDFFSFAAKNNIEYILIENQKHNEDFLKIIEFEKIKENEKYFGFNVIKKNSRFVLLEKI